jgi:IS4 transposase
MRMPVTMVRRSHVVRPLGSHDQLVAFIPCRATRQRDPSLPDQITARLIPYQIPGFRPSWLLTSLLDPEICSREELVDLYHRRWQMETIYREWKHALNIQNLRSHTAAGIFKEAFAQLMLSNLVRWVMSEAAQETTLHPVDFSYVTALSAVKNSLLQMLRIRPNQIEMMYQQLLLAVRSAPIRKRPGRSYPRPYDQPQDKGNGTITVPAKLPEP